MNSILLTHLARNWWVLLLRGLAGILFGLLTFAWPHITLLSLILLYGVYAGATGICEIIAAIRGGTMGSRWWLAFAGIVALFAAAVTFMMPGVTALVLLYIIGVWAVVHGVFEIAGAIQLRKEIPNEWMLMFEGLLSVLFGLCIFLWPKATALTLVWLIGFYAVLGGIFCVFLALRLKKHVAHA